MSKRRIVADHNPVSRPVALTTARTRSNNGARQGARQRFALSPDSSTDSRRDRIMTTPAIQGVLPVVPLPYHDDYTIDYATLQREKATRGAASIFEGAGGQALVKSFPHGVSGTRPGADCVWALVARAVRWRQREGASHSCSAIRTMRAARDRRRVSSRGKILLVKQGIFRNTFIRGPLGSVPDSKTESAVLAAFDRLRDAA